MTMTTTTSLAIQAQGLRKSYGSKEAVRGVDLEVRTGEILALLGPNGAGKTTTVEILEGFHQASSGEVRVLGEDPWGADRAHRDRIGIVLQESEPEINLTVRECLELYAGYYSAPRGVDDTIALAGLSEQGDQQTTRLSGGQRRRLDVALALIGDPELIFLDEPTTGFDPAARRASWEVISGLRALGTTILLTTHYMEEAERLADRIAVMRDGIIVATGTPATLGGRNRAGGTIAFTLPDGIELDELAPGASLDGERRVVMSSTAPMADLHELTGQGARARPRAVGHRGPAADPGGRLPGAHGMTATLVLHQLRFDVRAALRNRRTVFFSIALPVLLLVVLTGLYGDAGTVNAIGQTVDAQRAFVPGIMALAILTSSFIALMMTVAGQRQAGVLKRRRATPVPPIVLILGRALTSMAISIAAVAVMLVIASAAYDIKPYAGWELPMLVSVVVASLCFASCGYAVAGLVTTPESAGPIVQVILLPLQLISGVYFPTDGLPSWLDTVASIFPLVHVTEAFQHAMFPNPSIAWGDLGVMAIWFVGAAFVAVRTFRWLPSR